MSPVFHRHVRRGPSTRESVRGIECVSLCGRTAGSPRGDGNKSILRKKESPE